jgi:hypothetical protein
MKNLLIALILLCFNYSTAQVVTLMYVEVSSENQQRFERLEKDYWSQIARKATYIIRKSEGNLKISALIRHTTLDK